MCDYMRASLLSSSTVNHALCVQVEEEIDVSAAAIMAECGIDPQALAASRAGVYIHDIIRDM
jgi:hypothetical protein